MKLAGSFAAVAAISFAAGIAFYDTQQERIEQSRAIQVRACEDLRNGTNTARLTSAGVIECHYYQTRIPDGQLFEPYKPSKRELRRILVRNRKMQRAEAGR